MGKVGDYPLDASPDGTEQVSVKDGSSTKRVTLQSVADLGDFDPAGTAATAVADEAATRDAADLALASALTSHAADSTAVHGITDTADLVTQTAVEALFRYKTADQTVTNEGTTYQADTHLTGIAVEANTVYVWEAMLVYDTPAAADLSVLLSAPAGAAGYWTPFSLRDVTTGTTADIQTSGRTLAQAGLFGGATGANAVARPTGVLVVGGTAGTFGLTWRQNVADLVGTTLKTYSWLRLVKVG